MSLNHARLPQSGLLLTNTSTPRYEDEIDLVRYGRFLASYWRLLVAGVVVGAVIGVMIASLTPARFQATATLLLTPASGSGALTAADCKALIRTPKIISDTLNELELHRAGMTTESFIDDAVDVQLIPSTNFVKVSVVLGDPTKARLAANLLATKAVALSRTINQQGGGATLKSLDKQVAQAAANVDNAQQRLLDYDRTTDPDLLEAEVKASLTRPSGAGSATAVNQRRELYQRRLDRTKLTALHEATVRLYADLVARQIQARSLAAADTPQLLIVDEAAQPDHPMARRRPQWGMLGGLIGAATGVVLALLLNKRQMAQIAEG